MRQTETSSCTKKSNNIIFLPVVGTVAGEELSVLTNSASPFIKIGSNVIQVGGRTSSGELYVAAFTMSTRKYDESTPTRIYADDTTAAEEGPICSFIF